MNSMHVIDYKIHGDDMQFVEVELDPQEAVVAEAGGMMYMDDGIAMETVFGDGSRQNSGFMGALLGAGKRLLTGESLWTSDVPRHDALYAAAVHGDTLLLVGLRQCTGLRLRDGNVVWKQPIEPPAGRGVLLGGQFLLPLSDGRVFVLEVNSIPAWQGLQSVADVDVAGALVEHLEALVERR